MVQSNNLWEQLTRSASSLTVGEDEEFNHNFFLRKLQEGTETVRGDEPSEARAEEPFVFWFVNGIWIMLVVGMAIWLWKFNGVSNLSQWMSTDSDEVYHRRLRERREAKKNEIPPEVRRKFLHKHFRESQVHMIVCKSNILRDVVSPSNSLIENEGGLNLNLHCESDEVCCSGKRSIDRLTEDNQNLSSLLVTTEEKNSFSCELPGDQALSSNVNVSEASKSEFVDDLESLNHFVPVAEDNRVKCDGESSICDIEVGSIDEKKEASSNYKEMLTGDKNDSFFDKECSYNDVEVDTVDTKVGENSIFDIDSKENNIGIQSRVDETELFAQLKPIACENSENNKEETTVQTKVMETSSGQTGDVEAHEGKNAVFTSYTMEISVDVAWDEGDPSNESGILVIPAKNGDRRVPNCCAVCLGPYEIGDDVVWSENPRCLHAFHEECVTEWLLKMQDGNPCPCCRSVFVDMEHIKPVKKNIFLKWVSRFRGNSDPDE